MLVASTISDSVPNVRVEKKKVMARALGTSTLFSCVPVHRSDGSCLSPIKQVCENAWNGNERGKTFARSFLLFFFSCVFRNQSTMRIDSVGTSRLFFSLFTPLFFASAQRVHLLCCVSVFVALTVLPFFASLAPRRTGDSHTRASRRRFRKETFRQTSCTRKIVYAKKPRLCLGDGGYGFSQRQGVSEKKSGIWKRRVLMAESGWTRENKKRGSRHLVGRQRPSHFFFPFHESVIDANRRTDVGATGKTRSAVGRPTYAQTISSAPQVNCPRFASDRRQSRHAMDRARIVWDAFLQSPCRDWCVGFWTIVAVALGYGGVWTVLFFALYALLGKGLLFSLAYGFLAVIPCIGAVWLAVFIVVFAMDGCRAVIASTWETAVATSDQVRASLGAYSRPPVYEDESGL